MDFFVVCLQNRIFKILNKHLRILVILSKAFHFCVIRYGNKIQKVNDLNHFNNFQKYKTKILIEIEALAATNQGQETLHYILKIRNISFFETQTQHKTEI